MFRSLALSLAVLSACAANARADLYFGTGTIQTGPVTTQVDVNRINGDAAAGIQFINGTSTNAVVAAPGTFNSIGSNLLSTYGIQTLGNQIPATYSNTPIVAVFAVQGHTNSGFGGQIFLDKATVALYSVPSIASYIPSDPRTWGFTPTAIASWTIRAGEQGVDKGPLQPGPGGGGPSAFNFTKDQWNQASITLSVGALNSGPFLFTEATNPNFWNLTGNPPVIPPGSIRGDEGVGIIVNESLLAATSGNTTGLAAGLGTANTIFNALLPGASAFGFATGVNTSGPGTGTASDFNPSTSTTGAPNSADQIFSLGSNWGLFVSANQETRVPEPATLAVFATMMGVGGLVYRRRRAA